MQHHAGEEGEDKAHRAERLADGLVRAQIRQENPANQQGKRPVQIHPDAAVRTQFQ